MHKNAPEQILNSEQIQNMTSLNLASMVIIHRAMGAYKEDAKLCMIELMKRKAGGDEFDFEKFIKENEGKYKIKPVIQSFASIKSQMSTAMMKTIMDIKTEKIDNIDNDEDEDDDLDI